MTATYDAIELLKAERDVALEQVARLQLIATAAENACAIETTGPPERLTNAIHALRAVLAASVSIANPPTKD